MNVRTVAFVKRNTHQQTNRFSLGKLLFGQCAVFPFVATGLRQQVFQQHQQITICCASVRAVGTHWCGD